MATNIKSQIKRILFACITQPFIWIYNFTNHNQVSDLVIPAIFGILYGELDKRSPDLLLFMIIILVSYICHWIKRENLSFQLTTLKSDIEVLQHIINRNNDEICKLRANRTLNVAINVQSDPIFHIPTTTELAREFLANGKRVV
jgi:hypothetical protein